LYTSPFAIPKDVFVRTVSSPTTACGQGGPWDETEDTCVVHLVIVNGNVSPPEYLHMPAVLDTGCKDQMLIPIKEGQKLQLSEDTLMTGESLMDAGLNAPPVMIYKPVQVLVPVLNDVDGQLAFYMPGWLRCTNLRGLLYLKRAQYPSAAPADQQSNDAGAKTVAVIGDKSEN